MSFMSQILSVIVYYTSYTAQDNEMLIIAFHCGCIPNIAFEVSKRKSCPWRRWRSEQAQAKAWGLGLGAVAPKKCSFLGLVQTIKIKHYTKRFGLTHAIPFNK